MKKMLALSLALLLALFCVPASAAEAGGSFGAYDRVFIIGVDGAGRFFRDADTPNFDRIFADGAVDYTARAETMTVSAQNWGSILSGVSFLRHGLTNDIAKERERSSATKYPTVFTYARRAFPEAELASFVHWSAINIGIIENDVGVKKVQNSSDEALTDEICDYFNAGNAPKLFFCHFDSVDAVGHEKGSKAPEYFAQITAVDACIGRIYDALVANGLMENGLFIVVSDHGHMTIGGHFGLTARETNTTVAVKGKTVVPGSAMDAEMRNRDVAAITLYALGLARPAHMSARLPANLFVAEPGETREIKNEIPDTILAKLAWIVTVLTTWI